MCRHMDIENNSPGFNGTRIVFTDYMMTKTANAPSVDVSSTYSVFIFNKPCILIKNYIVMSLFCKTRYHGIMGLAKVETCNQSR